MGAGMSKLTPPPPMPPPPPPPPPPADDVVAALVEAGPVLARLATAILTSPRFVLLITLVVIGMAARFEGSFSSSAYILAIFSAVMGLHAATPASPEPTEADESWLGFDPMSPAALGMVGSALVVLPLYRDGRVTLRCVGFVATFLLVQSGIEALQLIADGAAWLLEMAGGWGAFSLAFRAITALLISRQVVASLPAPKPPALPAAPATRTSGPRVSGSGAPGSPKVPKPPKSLLSRASMAVAAMPNALLEVGRLAKATAALKLGVRRFNQAATSARKSVLSTGFKGLTKQLTQPFNIEKQGSGWNLKRLRSISSVSIDERQEMALRAIQAFYRFRLVQLETRRKQALAATGGIIFRVPEVERRGGRRPSAFVRVRAPPPPDESVGGRDAHQDAADTAARWLVHDCGAGVPSVLISVTGGAQNFRLPQNLQAAFERGLMRAARSGNTWIITGGTDSGVMKLIGQAIADYSADNVTAVGIATWGIVMNRHELEHGSVPPSPPGKAAAAAVAASGGDPSRLTSRVSGSFDAGLGSGEEVGTSVLGLQEYTGHRSQNSADGAALEPNHSHFILVDTKKNGRAAWGGEIAMRFTIEKTICERFSVPMVLVVVEGGPGTIKTVSETIKGGCPVVLVQGSGGAADVIARCFELLPEPKKSEADSGGDRMSNGSAESPMQRGRRISRSDSGIRFTPADNTRADEAVEEVELEPRFEKLRDELRTIMLYAGGMRRLGKPLLFCFDIDSDANAGIESHFDAHLLKAVLEGPAIASRGKLVLAVTWNNASVVRELLDEGTEGGGGGSGVGVGGGGGAGTPRGDSSGADAPPGTSIEGDDLLVALRHAITVVKDAELATEMVTLLLRHSRMRLEHFNFTQLPLVGGDQVGEAYDSNMQWAEVLAELMPSTWEFSNTLGGGDKDDDKDADEGPSLSHQASSSSSNGASGGDGEFVGPGMLELMLWAVLDGRDRLAETLWRECDEPCRYALLVSQLYSKLSKQAKTSQAEEALIEMSSRFEAWAVGMLSECPQSAAAALIEGHTARWHMSLLQLALSGHSKHFIAHEHCQSIIKQRWRGNYVGSGCMLAENSTFSTVLARALCQFLPDLLGEGALYESAAQLYRPDSYRDHHVTTAHTFADVATTVASVEFGQVGGAMPNATLMSPHRKSLEQVAQAERERAAAAGLRKSPSESGLPSPQHGNMNSTQRVSFDGVLTVQAGEDSANGQTALPVPPQSSTANLSSPLFAAHPPVWRSAPPIQPPEAIPPSSRLVSKDSSSPRRSGSGSKWARAREELAAEESSSTSAEAPVRSIDGGEKNGSVGGTYAGRSYSAAAATFRRRPNEALDVATVAKLQVVEKSGEKNGLGSGGRPTSPQNGGTGGDATEGESGGGGSGHAGFWHIPRVKFVLRASLEVLYLLHVSTVLLMRRVCVDADGNPKLRPAPLEALLYMWTAALVLDEFYQFKLTGSLRDHLATFWNRVDLTKYVLLSSSAALHVIGAVLGAAASAAPASSYAPYLLRGAVELLVLHRTALALGALVCTTRLFAMILLDRQLGVLILSCARMGQDVFRFMTLLSVIMLGFGLAFSGLHSAGQIGADIPLIARESTAAAALEAAAGGGAGGEIGVGGGGGSIDALGSGIASLAASLGSGDGADDATGSDGDGDCGEEGGGGGGGSGGDGGPDGPPIFFMPFWAIFGDTLGYEAPMQTGAGTARVSLLLLWLYFLVAQVVLLNLLIAMMSDTWSSVKEHADEEWKFLSVASIDEYFDLHHVPPPFNCTQLARDIYRHYADGIPIVSSDNSSSLLLTAADIKKRSKGAQVALLQKEEDALAETPAAQLEVLRRAQREVFEKLDRLIVNNERTAGQIHHLQRLQATAHDVVPGASASSQGGAPSAHVELRAKFPLGSRVRHPDRGVGTVTEHMEDGRTRIAFDEGDEHRYKPSSMHKIVLVAAPYTPPTADAESPAAAPSGGSKPVLSRSNSSKV